VSSVAVVFIVCSNNSVRCANGLVLPGREEVACHSVTEWLTGIGTWRAADRNVAECDVT
jgi:hypothetical protein